MNTDLKVKINRFLGLLIPILVTQVTLFSMAFFDTVMSGNSSPEDLAGVAIGVSIWVPISTGLTGILAAVTTLVSNYHGAKENDKIAPLIIQGVYLATTISVSIIIIGAFALNPILSLMDLEPKVQQVAHDFLVTLSFGIIPLYIYNVIRYFIDGIGKTRTTMFITIMYVPINIFLNYLFIFGNYGFPKLGGVGAAVGSAITYWVILLIAIYIVRTKKPFTSFSVLTKFEKVSFEKWKVILTLGIPIGLSIFFEVSIFSVVTLLLSEFDTKTIAAHTIAMNFASMLYMLPLSISMALTIAVGFEVGARNFENARKYGFIGIAMALLFATAFGIIIYFFRFEVAGMYTNDLSVQTMAGGFLIFAILFQLSDAVAAPIQGALRGYRDVNATMIMMIISYWLIALPCGYLLVKYTDWGAKGYWIGLIIGLAVSASTLLGRLLILQKRKAEEALNA
ncbi:MAG: efflux family protein [Bacillales bacterium]|jgi:MATE family multidrug resistance protein|nr:efflux family protein [Bacillales bacterium]